MSPLSPKFKNRNFFCFLKTLKKLQLKISFVRQFDKHFWKKSVAIFVSLNIKLQQKMNYKSFKYSHSKTVL